MDAFLEIFGDVTIATATQVIIALAFVIYIGKLCRDYTLKRHEDEREKDEKLNEALEAVKKYPEYRQQSLDIQKKLEDEIQEIKNSQEANLRRLEKMEENTKRLERNKCRDRLLQNYRYYTSKDKNPMKAWTSMEAEAFWELFKDYENMDGNGYVHSEVQPAMNRLEVIDIEDVVRITELMESRK